jgi:hypothetical protein
MANPYAFGQKDYSTLDRRRKVIEDAMRSSFETNTSITQMQKEKEQRDRIKAITNIYSQSSKDQNLQPEKRVDLALEASSQLLGLGAHNEAEGIIKHAQTYAGLAKQKAPKWQTGAVLDETGNPKTVTVNGVNVPLLQYVDEQGGVVLGTDQKPIYTYGQTPQKRPEGNQVIGTSQGFDAKAIAKAIEKGEQPPTMEGLSRGQGGIVKSELAKLKYPQALAEQDWKATSRHFQTLNGTQQTRLRQAATTARESLDIIDQLSDKWNGGKYPLLNKVNLSIAKNGGLGQEAQNIATTLEAQITDVVSEMSNVYMGGNSPTDQALKLAGKNLSADWSRGQLKAATDLARKNLTIRLNSIANTGTISATGQNQYGGGGQVETGQQPTQNTIAPEDQEAVDWAKANSNDPRAIKILQLHGIK